MSAAEDLARRIESQALISYRPGQLTELEQIAREVCALGVDLAAAQAAIQRVREKHFQTIGGYCHVCATWDPITGASGVPYPCPTVRALDGDTTEES